METYIYTNSFFLRNSMSLFEPKLTTVARKQELKYFGGQFCYFFYTFEIKKKT